MAAPSSRVVTMLKMRLFDTTLPWEKLAIPGLPALSGQPPQPIDTPEYGRWSIWLWVSVVFAAYPMSTPIPPRYSTGVLKTWLSAIVLPIVCEEPVALGRSTLPSSMPLPEVSVTTLPLTSAFWVPSPRPNPAPPRWTNASPVKETFRSYVRVTLAGIWNQLNRALPAVGLEPWLR